eukprot:gene20312-biopygen5570
MIWVASGSSLAFQRLSRDSIFAILSIRKNSTTSTLALDVVRKVLDSCFRLPNSVKQRRSDTDGGTSLQRWNTATRR